MTMMANHCGNPECDACTETERQIRDIHTWLSELMPAARVAVKMMDARANLVKRWRGGKG